MQLYALDSTAAPVMASNAEKGKDYLCPECQALVRVRSGPSRQIHFYHLALPSKCRQHEKSQEHIQLQLKLLELFGDTDAQIECPFPAIKRIADFACHAKKMIFEIQCSPISLEEVQCRILDYNAMGYEVVWILHERRFNRKNLSAAEHFLRESPCYFTNIDKAGLGVVYDQFDIIKKYKRVFKGPPLTVSLDKFTRLPLMSPPEASLPLPVKSRFTKWKCYMEGDLLHRLLKEGKLSDSAKKLMAIESQILEGGKKPAPKLPVKQLVANSYRSVLDYLLKKLTRAP